jgi:NAD(P)-dependent dehydrogenase (short-subunit alcohol dehydrogenase family)
MLLENKNAVIYGAGGSLGGAIAHALAKAGAKVFVSGLHLASVKKLADEIIAAGGKAEAFEVDAMNEKAVTDFIEHVVKKGGSVDISFNAIDLQPVQNIPLVAMSVEDFVRPVNRAMQSQFITCTAAAKVMIPQRSGVILLLTATPGGIGYPLTGGFGVACCAMEGLCRNMASEVGAYGVRVVTIRSGGSQDSKVFKDAIAMGGDDMKQLLKVMEGDAMLKKMPLMQDVANVAVFLSSDMAAMITGVTVDVTGGATNALNYKVSATSIEKSESSANSSGQAHTILR